MLVKIYNVVSMKSGWTLAVCMSRSEAEDAFQYYVHKIGYDRDALIIQPSHAYRRGWFKSLMSDYVEHVDLDD